MSYTKQHPVRVFRSSNLNSEFAPPQLDDGRTSYRYDGLCMSYLWLYFEFIGASSYSNLLVYNTDVVTKVWDSLGNMIGMNHDGIPTGGTQFTFHLDRIQKMEPYSNHLSLQELWEKILLSHGRQHRLFFEPPRSMFFDKLPVILNTQREAKSTEHYLSVTGEEKGARNGYKGCEIYAGASIRNLELNCEGEAGLRPSLSKITIHKTIPANIRREEQKRQKRKEQQMKVAEEVNVAVGPQSDIWLPIENFPAWHMTKKEQWRKKRSERIDCIYPEKDCNFTDSQSIIKHFRFVNGKGRLRPSLSEIATRQTIQEKIRYIKYWRNLTGEEQVRQRKDMKESKVTNRNAKKRKRKEQVKPNISLSLDAVEEIEVFLHSIVLKEYWRNFDQPDENACRQLEVFTNRLLRNICGDSPADNAMTIIRRALIKRESLSTLHRLDEGVPQLESTKRKRVPIPEPTYQLDKLRVRQSVIRFTTNVEEGTQSISQPLEALYCVDQRRKLFKQVKVSVKWGISKKSRKKSLREEKVHQLHLIKQEKTKMSTSTAQIIKPTTTRRSIVRFTTNEQEGIQSITQPLEATYCVSKAKKTYKKMKVTVKWGLGRKSHKKSLHQDKYMEKPILVDEFEHETSTHEVASLSADTNTPPPPPSTSFNINENVFAWDRNHLYKAKILKVKEDTTTGLSKYLVHYVGYSKNHDRWLLPNKILQDNPAVRSYFDDQS